MSCVHICSLQSSHSPRIHCCRTSRPAHEGCNENEQVSTAYTLTLRTHVCDLYHRYDVRSCYCCLQSTGFSFFLISFSLPAKNSTRYLGHFLRNRSTVTFIYYYLQLGLVEQYIISRGHVCWCLSHLTKINPCFLSRDTPYLLEHKIPHRPTLVSKIQSNGLRASLSCYSPPVVDCTSPDEHTTLKPSCPLRHGEMPATPL